MLNKDQIKEYLHYKRAKDHQALKFFGFIMIIGYIVGVISLIFSINRDIYLTLLSLGLLIVTSFLAMEYLNLINSIKHWSVIYTVMFKKPMNEEIWESDYIKMKFEEKHDKRK